MKPKLVFAVLAGLMICSIFSTSQGEDNFYYGSLHCLGHGTEYVAWQKDSLKFNIGGSFNIDSSNVDSFARYSMRAIPENEIQDISPYYWSKYSHYTLWEAEGLDGSYYTLSYDGGEPVNDPYASGGKAMKFSGPGEPGIIQWGPSYEQEPDHWGPSIYYTAEFRLKYIVFTPRGAMGGNPPDSVCRIMVVDRETILTSMKLSQNNFTGAYQTFKLENYTVSQGNSIQFKIRWFGRPGDFYVDYVKVYDDYGHRLIDLRLADQRIMNYVSQDWVHTTIPATGETVVYRWYMRDQPGYIDCFAPYAHIDTLLKQVSAERLGMQAFKRILKPRKSLMPNPNKDFSPRWMLPSALIP
jgi:hypothetical protein